MCRDVEHRYLWNEWWRPAKKSRWSVRYLEHLPMIRYATLYSVALRDGTREYVFPSSPLITRANQKTVC
jgi:hypothetical protein